MSTAISFMVLFGTINCMAQFQKKKVDAVQTAYFSELKKYLYPPVDSLTTKELAVFVLFPNEKPNSSLRVIERKSKTYIEVRILHKNVGVELLTAFKSHNYRQLALQSDSFTVEVSKYFKFRILEAFRKTVNEKFIDMFPRKIEIYDGTIFNFWFNENTKTTSKNIREDGNSMYFGWKFAKINLQIIDDIKNGVFEESKYDIYK